MLINHKLRVQRNDYIEDIPFERPQYSLDGRSMTCVVSQKHKLTTGDELLIEINDGNQEYVKITAENFIEQGWCYVNKIYKLLPGTQDGPPPSSIVDIEQTTWYYFTDDDGIIKEGYEYPNGIINFPSLGVSTIKFDKENSLILLPKKFYVKNGFVEYNNGEYVQVQYDDDGNVFSFIEFPNGENSIVEGGKKEEWKNQTEIQFILPQDVLLPIDEIYLGKYVGYVDFEGTEYILKTRPTYDEFYDTYNQRYIPSIESKDGKEYVEGYIDEDDEYVETLLMVGDEAEFAYPNTIKLWDGAIHEIKNKVEINDGGDVFIFALNSDAFSTLQANEKIIANRVSSTLVPYNLSYDNEGDPILNNDGYKIVVIDDLEYPVKSLEMLDFNGLHELFKSNDDDLYYIVLNNNKNIYFTKKEENVYALLFNEDITYESFFKEQVVYNNHTYYKDLDIPSSIVDDEYTEEVLNPFMLPSKPKYVIKVIDYIEPNLYYCKLDDDNTTFLTPYYNKKSWIYRDIVFNYGKYVFYKQPALFFDDKNEDKSFFNLIDEALFYDFEPKIDVPPLVSLKKIISNISIPISLSTLHGTNINQEIDVKASFVNNVIEKKINRIVDMEKDIYYPAIIKNINEDSVELEDVTDIEFFLHLRTRNDLWEVHDDVLSEVEYAFGEDYVKTITAEIKNSNPNITYETKYINTSWNLIDYYKQYCDNHKESYYQPSDLLGFFDFNDDDVFYQKSKLGKTFLRMSFYDTKDPQTQSLLATSTVFLDARTIFGKFIDKMSNPDNRLKFKNPLTWIGNSSSISCSLEPVYGSDLLHENDENGIKCPIGPSNILDDSLRMSSTVTITNKIATESTSEGFYNYIFREYSNNLHERTIYLKIQLNHAGHGQVIDLIQPMYRDELGIQHLMNLNQMLNGDENLGIKSIKNGVDLKLLYDMMYIPIKVKYDDTLKKYCWYLPKELVKHEENKIKFNLYEIKVNKV